ncbi:hypothetical protein G7Z17_g858 [Cylindrodendrum hubeiense]|uniref:Exo-1,4-beta-D-glucosaminidase n=1 Tax=Cylindrodendrum hubeiense TaxID=595255 RepID=A0A9P5LKS2_9HYPO|nr:hypothetical protein G7Z17_g858 [Cylindrodendrum hubeiense]
MFTHALATILLAIPALIAANPLTSKSGQKGVIQSWDLQTSSIIKDPASASKSGYDTSSWHHIPTSKCTLMGCLLASNKFNDSDLWFSDNMNKFNWGQFLVPWVYRNEFSLVPKSGQHYFLNTNGISSGADLYLNGKRIADSKLQAGSFGGHVYDITWLVSSRNALTVSVYPSDFNYDLVQGFVDWNIRAPDNGSGIWRDIFVTQTGSVAMGPVSISIDMEMPVENNPATVIIRAKAQNLENHRVQFVAKSIITSPSGSREFHKDQCVTLESKETRIVEITHRINNPNIWWPKTWGSQPLYQSRLTFSVDSELSDVADSRFGIRTVTSHINIHNDTQFTLNGHPFQVLGGGYSPDHFFRWDRDRFITIAKYILDMGLNTLRLEGSLEHPELYEIADEMGIMIIAGWVCCSKWESWDFNHNLGVEPVPLWVEGDYETANASIRHEAAMMQPHPSMLAFFVGSDFWPNDRATKIYVDGLKQAFWQTPIIASASKRGYPKLLGPAGMKMDGPYDWVPPNYWYDIEPSEERLGAAFGFGSELGAGVGTPEIGSLKRFLSQEDMDDLWKHPNKNLFHMSTNTSSFYNREIYNDGLFNRYGSPKSLDDYLLKAQIMDYEATRAQNEAYSAHWNSERPATGTIYWMLNNAWPSLHWNQFDHYMHPAGSYFGSKIGLRIEHIAYDYVKNSIWIINHTINRQGARKVSLELVDLQGKVLGRQAISVTTKPNTSANIWKVSGLEKIRDVAFLRLVLSDDNDAILSRNVYWIAKSIDKLDWDNSTWYHTPVTDWSDFSALAEMRTAKVTLKLFAKPNCGNGENTIELANMSPVPAFFIRLSLVDKLEEDINPVIWSDNYVTLWPGEKIQLDVQYAAKKGAVVKLDGGNVKPFSIALKCS